MTGLPGRVAQAARPGGRLALAFVATGLTLVVMIAGAGPAAAHPVGNYTMNRYARVEVSAGTIRVYYVVDLAEIPSYQVRKLVDADPDGYVAGEVTAVVRGLDLELDDRPVELRTVRQELSRPRGEGGMRRVRIDAVLEGPLPRTGPDQVIEGRFADSNQPERIGWREILVVAAGDATVVESSAPSNDVADELRDYPEALLQDPIDVRAATFPSNQAAARLHLPALVPSTGSRVVATASPASSTATISLPSASPASSPLPPSLARAMPWRPATARR